MRERKSGSCALRLEEEQHGAGWSKTRREIEMMSGGKQMMSGGKKVALLSAQDGLMQIGLMLVGRRVA